jgi:hypothetical protein
MFTKSGGRTGKKNEKKKKGNKCKDWSKKINIHFEENKGKRVTWKQHESMPMTSKLRKIIKVKSENPFRTCKLNQGKTCKFSFSCLYIILL